MSQYKYLLFDFDNTLVDFTGAAKAALWQTFADFDQTCTEEIYGIYKTINHAVWTAFEEGRITAERLRVKRFEDLFAQLAKVPARPADFSVRFLENLVTKSTAYPGVSELLAELQKTHELGLITNGLREVQRPRLDRLQLTDYFKFIVVSDEIGVAKPDVAFFDYAYAQLPKLANKSNILVIGDNLQSDILGAVHFGVDSCWVSHGRAAIASSQPTYTIETVHDLPKILATRGQRSA